MIKKIKMKPVRVYLMSLLIIILITACSEDTIFGSGNLVSETRKVSDFNSISSEGVFEVNITQEDTQYVEVTADDNIIQNVRTKVSGKQLSLSLKSARYRDISLKSNIKAAALKGIFNSGSGNINAFNIEQKREFNVINSGTANITIQGETARLLVLNDGSGDINGFDFTVSSCEIDNVGSGDIRINCIESMDISISGSGNVYYKGHPEIDVSIEGSGKVIDAN